MDDIEARNSRVQHLLVRATPSEVNVFGREDGATIVRSIEVEIDQVLVSFAAATVGTPHP